MADNSVEKENAFKKWIIGTIGIFAVMVIIASALVLITDPFFHFHKPITKYRLNNERYINDGIARHFEYDAIITGNSLTENFKVSEYDELFEVNAIKLPYSGADTVELWQALGRAIGRNATDMSAVADKIDSEYRYKYEAQQGYNNSVRNVLTCLYIEDIMREDYWSGYEGAPEYLYDDDPINDIKYILNKDVLYRGTFFNILLTLRGGDSTSFDEYCAWERSSGYKQAVASLDRIEYRNPEDDRIMSEYDAMVIDNCLDHNVIPVIEANPDTEFTFFFPPFSIAKWADYYNEGKVEYTIDCMAHIIDRLVGYDNVKIFGFDDEYELATDLSRYCDTIHYDADVNSWILTQIAADRHLITEDNKAAYTDTLKEYYVNYDYTGLNEYME